jgi:hypothetical protein
MFAAVQPAGAQSGGPAASQSAREPDLAPEPAAAKPQVVQPSTPDFALVEATVSKYFASFKDYQDGDLIRQSQAAGALAAVKDIGWDVAEREAILKRVLGDGSFLVKELSTPLGRAFMRRVGRHSGTYSRLERLSTIAGGEQLIHDLIRQRDGDKLIEYMATTKGGRNMGRMAADTRHGVDLNKATGHIYTASELVAELEKAYRAKDAKKPRS